MHQSPSQHGHIILEVLIAFAIFMLSIGSVVITTYGADQLAVDAGLSLHALYNAQDALETIRGIAEKKFDAVASSSNAHDQYHEDVVVQFASPFSWRVDVTERWDAFPGRHQQTTLSTLVSNRELLLGNTPCSALAGDVTHASLLGSIDISSANHGTDVDIASHYAYLATNSSTTSDPDFFVIDVSDSAYPNISASINTGPGLVAVRVVGNYAYVANASRTAQLQVIDIHDATHPFVVASLRLPGVSGSGTAGVGNSMTYANGKVYIGTTKATGPELHIIDVSDPLHPSEIGSWEAGTSINGIVHEGLRLYVATPTASQLRVLDTTDPSHIAVMTQLNPSDASTNDGESILIAGTFLYFGRNAKATSSASAQQLFFLDTQHEDVFDSVNALHIDASVNDIVGHTGRLVLATNDAANSLQLWNVDDPMHPARITTVHLAAVPVALACDDISLYAALNSGHALQIIKISP